MTFQVFNTAISTLIKAVQNVAISSVRSLKDSVFSVKLTNPTDIQKVVGRIFVVNKTDIHTSDKKTRIALAGILGAIKAIKSPESIKVSNFPEIPKKIEVTNFPKYPEFPNFPKEIKVSNQTDLSMINVGIDKLTGEVKKLKLNPTINVEAPKPERLIVPPANITVTQQEIDYEKLAKAISDEIPTIDYKKLAAALAKEVAPISVSGGGGGRYSYKDSTGRGATALVDDDRHVQVDVVTMPTGDTSNPETTLSYNAAGDLIQVDEEEDGVTTTQTFSNTDIVVARTLVISPRTSV